MRAVQHFVQLLVCAGLHVRPPVPSPRGADHRPRIAVPTIVRAPAAAALSAGAPNPRDLNVRLVQATSVAELLQLHADYGDRFDDINLATCWSRLGRARSRERAEMLHRDGGGRQLSALREQTIARLDGWDARGLANLAHALGQLKLRGSAWVSLWEALAQASVLRCGGFKPQALANTAWAYAKAGHSAPALLDAIAEEAAPRLGEFKPQELASTAWAYATADHAAPALLDAIAKEAAPRLGEFKPQGLANTAWAYAKAGHAAPALLDAIAKEAAPRLGEFNAQDLANTAWAYATTGHVAPALLDAIAEEAAPRLREFKAQALANTAWAYAKAGHAVPALLDAIATEAAPRLGEFKPQGLANMAWAYATAGHAAPALLDAIAKEAAPQLREFTPQELAITSWAYATAGHAAPTLLAAIAKEAARRLGEFQPQGLANMAWAYATAGHAAPALLDAIAKEAAPRLGEFKPQELANMAWTYATAGHVAPALLDAIAKESARRVGEFDPQGLANTAWAFAAADCPADELFGERFGRRCDELAIEFTIDALSQLHQWRLWHAGERGRSDGLPSEALLERCRTAFASAEAQQSGFQRQVGAALASLGLSPMEEVELDEGYSLDLVVEWRGERLGVEVDGPSHFVGRKVNGATLLKRRQLRHLGWRLVSVPYWEWDALQTPALRAEYMASSLGPSV